MNTLEKVQSLFRSYYSEHHDKIQLEKDLAAAIDDAGSKTLRELTVLILELKVETRSQSAAPPDQL